MTPDMNEENSIRIGTLTAEVHQFTTGPMVRLRDWGYQYIYLNLDNARAPAQWILTEVLR